MGSTLCRCVVRKSARENFTECGSRVTVCCSRTITVICRQG